MSSDVVYRPDLIVSVFSVIRIWFMNLLLLLLKAVFSFYFMCHNYSGIQTSLYPLDSAVIHYYFTKNKHRKLNLASFFFPTFTELNQHRTHVTHRAASNNDFNCWFLINRLVV